VLLSGARSHCRTIVNVGTQNAPNNSAATKAKTAKIASTFKFKERSTPSSILVGVAKHIKKWAGPETAFLQHRQNETTEPKNRSDRHTNLMKSLAKILVVRSHKYSKYDWKLYQINHATGILDLDGQCLYRRIRVGTWA
jgi:hypothetical protein